MIPMIFTIEVLLKGCEQWFEQFDHVHDCNEIKKCFEGDVDVYSFNVVVDILYGVEIDMIKFLFGVKAITNATQITCLNELEAIKVFVWTTNREL